MSAEPQRVVIVGAGLGGLRTAEELRQLGYAGKLTLIGGEAHPPYSRPPLSKEVLRGDAEPESAHLRGPDALGELDIDLRLGKRATALDPAAHEVALGDGSSVRYDRLVIATGATPRTLPGVAGRNVHVLRTIDDAVALRDVLKPKPRVAVVGAGFIGSEVASSARTIGCEVTVLEVMSGPLVHALGPEIATGCANLQQRAGVDLRCNVAVTAVDDERVWLDDGSSIDADVVVVGIGVRPELDWLASSGLTIDNGILCDEFSQASAPDVYAVGDVARWHNPLFGEAMRLEHWTNATEQACAVARNIAGDPEPFAPVPYFWSDQFGTKIQVLGRPRADDDVRVVRGSIDEGKFVAVYGRDSRLTGVVGFSSARYVMAFRPMLASGAAYDDAIAS
jgi:3-phenylpropionate/trans-cinnamate dioxygenase ferredoxin reductase subunit